MGCEHLDDIYELFLLGALEAAESQRVEDHLTRGCANCLGRLREASQTVYLFTLSVAPARPNPKKKAQLLSRLHKK